MNHTDKNIIRYIGETHMTIGLGIDTGGTYTDGVLYDFDTKQVLCREKRLTTPRDLSEGIANLLDALDPALLPQVKMTALSTTLATNACVEGRGGRAALVLMGYRENLVHELAREYGLDAATEIFFMEGSHSQRGAVVQEPDMAALDTWLEGLDQRVEAVGVCEYWGVRNPEYEQQVKARIREKFSLPVAAAHELTSEINSMRRASTTLLNARLIFLIDDLLKAVTEALQQRNVSAPMMIVRGDGSLMTEEFARECPVETMLSGPAASVTGAMRLSGETDMICADIGGTTTDLAVVRHGRTRLVDDGVNVGAWRTGTRAVEIRTVGLGGDSAVDWSSHKGLMLQETRALPLCALASRYPHIKDTLRSIRESERQTTYNRGVFFVLNRRPPAHFDASIEESAMLDALSGGPLTLEELAAAMKSKPYFIKPGRLENMGLVLRSQLTPTDMLHLSGEYDAFDSEASRLGLQLLAFQADMTEDAIQARVMDMASEKLFRLISRELFMRANPKMAPQPDAEKMAYLPLGDEIEMRVELKIPIVGIGAPAASLLQGAAQRLHARLVLPQDYRVANAVGAITGSVLCESRVEIKPKYDALGINGYTAHASDSRFESESLEECVLWARKTAVQLAERQARRMGAADVTVEMDDQESNGYAAGEIRQSMLLERRIVARATGRVSIV